MMMATLIYVRTAPRCPAPKRIISYQTNAPPRGQYSAVAFTLWHGKVRVRELCLVVNGPLHSPSLLNCNFRLSIPAVTAVYAEPIVDAHNSLSGLVIVATLIPCKIISAVLADGRNPIRYSFCGLSETRFGAPNDGFGLFFGDNVVCRRITDSD